MIQNVIKDGKAWQAQGDRKPLEYSPPDESHFACETGNLIHKELNISINSTFQE